jgi:transposase
METFPVVAAKGGMCPALFYRRKEPTASRGQPAVGETGSACALGMALATNGGPEAGGGTADRRPIRDRTMSNSIHLRPDDRKALLGRYRGSPAPAVCLRCHILLLLDAGHPWELIAAVLFTSSATINRWRRAYLRGGIDAVLAVTPGRRARRWWVEMIVRWVLTLAPADFGFARSRWTCEAVAVVLREDHGVRVSREAVRRRLRERGLVWRRPRPVVRRTDPERPAKLAALRRLLATLPPDETAVFMDEVEVHTNPKVGSMWMWRGEQATVDTPGDNEKRVLAGSLHWRTGRLIETWGGEKEGRTAALFCRHLDDLRRAFRHYKVVHIICDNALNHRPDKSRVVRAYLAAWAERVRVHFLPKYAPDTNPVEEVWWRLHESVTRNHRCRSMRELIDLTMRWFDERRFFRVERQTYKSQ